MTVRAQKIETIAQELVDEGVLTADQLAVALESQKNLGGNLDDILVQRRFLSKEELNTRLAEKAGIAVISLATYQPDTTVLKLIPVEKARQWSLFPLFETEEKLTVATADPFDLTVLDGARMELDKEIDFVLASREEIDNAIEQHYGDRQKEDNSATAVEVVGYETSANVEEESTEDQLEREAQASRVVNTVDQVLAQAFRERASDIHFGPTRDALKIRLRIDGVLEEIQSQPKPLHQGMLSRLKILGGMDVAEHRIPQDGRVRLKIDSRELDLRIATYPTMFGEAAAIRLLSKQSLITLEDLGFVERDLHTFTELVHKPHGILLVTGPTGSGKTTTLYAALQEIDRQKHHVLSVEDPIENEIAGVDQTQINPKAGLTFPTALRAMLRQDPDIIMVGEIRDQETADISLRAAMTGHLVLSTLHTNTAIGAVARLVDLGIEPYLISSTLLGVMAQRLVRRICPTCRVEAPLPAEALHRLSSKAEGLQAFRGKGCRECGMRGYKGRIALFELVRIDDELRVLINNSSPEVRLKEKATAAGFHTIFEDGIEKIRQGLTTIEEVLKVTVEG